MGNPARVLRKITAEDSKKYQEELAKQKDVNKSEFDYCKPHTCDFNHELGNKIVSVYRNMYVEIDKELSNTV